MSLDLHVTKKRAELTRAHRERNRAANRSGDNQGSAPRAVHDQHGLDRRTGFRVMRRSIDVVDLVAADDLFDGEEPPRVGVDQPRQEGLDHRIATLDSANRPAVTE